MGFEFENRRARTISEPQKSFQLVGDERGVGFRPFFFEFGRGRVVQKMGANSAYGANLAVTTVRNSPQDLAKLVPMLPGCMSKRDR
jgi:hypothetical protein